MPKAEIDAAFLLRHNLLTLRFYQAKRAGLVTPRLQALFDKAHTFLTLTHERAIHLLGAEAEARGEGDYYVDEKWDESVDPPVLLQPGTKLRSQEIAEALAGAFKLKASEIVEVLSRWGVSLG